MPKTTHLWVTSAKPEPLRWLCSQGSASSLLSLLLARSEKSKYTRNPEEPGKANTAESTYNSKYAMTSYGHATKGSQAVSTVRNEHARVGFDFSRSTQCSSPLTDIYMLVAVAPEALRPRVRDLGFGGGKG